MAEAAMERLAEIGRRALAFRDEVGRLALGPPAPAATEPEEVDAEIGRRALAFCDEVGRLALGPPAPADGPVTRKQAETVRAGVAAARTLQLPLDDALIRRLALQAELSLFSVIQIIEADGERVETAAEITATASTAPPATEPEEVDVDDAAAQVRQAAALLDSLAEPPPAAPGSAADPLGRPGAALGAAQVRLQAAQRLRIALTDEVLADIAQASGASIEAVLALVREQRLALPQDGSPSVRRAMEQARAALLARAGGVGTFDRDADGSSGAMHGRWGDGALPKVRDWRGETAAQE